MASTPLRPTWWVNHLSPLQDHDEGWERTPTSYRDVLRHSGYTATINRPINRWFKYPHMCRRLSLLILKRRLTRLAVCFTLFIILTLSLHSFTLNLDRTTMHPHRSLSFCLALIVGSISLAIATRMAGGTPGDVFDAALARYIAIHHNQDVLFEPHPVDLEHYRRMHIPNLQSEALRLGQERGVLYIGRTQDRLPSTHAVYFSTLIRPTDQLGHDMNLGNKVALALWRKGLQGLELLDIDAFTNHGVEWPLKPFRRVVGIH